MAHITIKHPGDVLRVFGRKAAGKAAEAVEGVRSVYGGPTVRARSYGAGNLSRLTEGWITTPESVDAVLRRELRILKARSRDQIQRNDYARRFVQLLQSNVLGAKGIALDSQVTDPEGTADTDAQEAIQDAWRRWGEVDTDSSPEVTGRLSWAECERLELKTAAGDGEFLLRYLEGRDFGPWAFQVQLLDTELLDVDLNTDLRNGNKIRQGVEVDRWGRRVNYYLHQAEHGSAHDSYAVHLGRKYAKVPASEIEHGFVQEWVGQRRGVPWLATSLERLKMVGAYEEAALTHARVGAQSLGFFSREQGATPFRGDTKSDRDDGSTDLNLEPGEFNTLPAGLRLESWDPKYPTGEFRPFIQTILKGISAGLGPAYTSLTQDLEGTSYAGGRMGLVEERELYKFLQTWFSGSLHRRVFLRWLRWALLTDQVRHLKTDTPLPIRRLAKFERHDWRGRRWPWVDPLNDAKAAVLLIENNLGTQSDTLLELGHDPARVWKVRQQELEEQARRDILPTASGSGGGDDPPPPDPDAPLVNQPAGGNTPAGPPPQEGEDDDE